MYPGAVSEKVRQIVADNPNCLLTSDFIHINHRLREDLDLDSLAMVDLMIALEDSFEFTIDPVQMDLDAAFETVGSLIEFVTAVTG